MMPCFGIFAPLEVKDIDAEMGSNEVTRGP
jgi:hypothetical protein